MPSRKDRLYVGLYSCEESPAMSGTEEKYQWGLLVGPKYEKKGPEGEQYRVIQRVTESGKPKWVFRDGKLAANNGGKLLVRIMVGKVLRKEHLAMMIRFLPIRQGVPLWNDVSWVKEGLKQFYADGTVIGTSVLQWQEVRDAAMWYVKKKEEENRWSCSGDFNQDCTPTYNLIKKSEIHR